jgi:hypothetical protein
MKKVQRTGFNIHPRYILQNGKNRDMKLHEAKGEGYDNSIAAGATEIIFTKEAQKKDGYYTITFEDNGSGIPSDKILKSFDTFGYMGNYGSKSTSLFGVGFKEMISYLCEFGQIDITSINQGIKSKLNISFKEDDFGFSSVVSEPTKEKSGTLIRITNVDMTIDEKDSIDLEQWLGCIYNVAKENNPNFKIIFKVKEKNQDSFETREIKFYDPMYRNLFNFNSNAVNKLLDRQEYEVDGEIVKLSIYQFDKELFETENLFSEFDRKKNKKGTFLKGKFRYEKAGIYWRLGNRYSNYGNGEFYSMRAQHTLDNVRIEIDITGPKLMKIFGTNQNKSKVSSPTQKTINSHPGLIKMFNDLSKHVTALHLSAQDKTKEPTKDEQTECQRINDTLNMIGDYCGITKEKDVTPYTIKNNEVIKDERIYKNTLDSFCEFCLNNDLIKTTFDECLKIEDDKYSVREIEYNFRETTFIRHKISSPVERGPFKLIYVNGHPKDNFLSLKGTNNNKYVFECNKSNPFYDVYHNLPDETTKTLIIVEGIALITALANMVTDKDIDKETYTSILNGINNSLSEFISKAKKKLVQITI